MRLCRNSAAPVLQQKCTLKVHLCCSCSAFAPPQSIAKSHPETFRLDYALSREQKNRKGGKMYIQDKMEEYADEIFTLLDEVRLW